MIKYHKILPYTLVMAMLSSSAAYAAPIQTDTKGIQTVASASDAELKDKLDVATASDASRQEAKDIIISMIQAENENDWNTFASYWDTESEQTFIDLFKDPNYTAENTGISTVESASLEYIHELTTDSAPYYMQPSEYEEYSDITYFLVGIDYSVREVNKYFYNGINFRLVAVGKDSNGDYKVLDRITAPSSLLRALETTRSSVNGLEDAVNTALMVDQAKNKGYIVDSDLTVYDTLTESAEEELQNQSLSRSVIKPGREDMVCQHDAPKNVKVLYNGKIYSPTLKEYVLDTVPNEFVVSTNIQPALKTAVVVVQQYATYYCLYEGKHPDTGYDLKASEGDQKYVQGSFNKMPEIYRTKLLTAYNGDSTDIVKPYLCHLESSTGKFFPTYYALDQSYLDKIGHDGLNQSEMAKMKDSEGWTLEKILRKYYHAGMDTDHLSDIGTVKIKSYTNSDIDKNGWIEENGNWYYYHNGVMLTGWQMINGEYYYLGTDGVMTTGWQLVDGVYYYMHSTGIMAHSEWVQDKNNGLWYYLHGDGHMAANEWIGSDSGGWYFVKEAGYMAKNEWISVGGYWYWLQEDGKMFSNGSLVINGVTRHFDSQGHCLNP